jgi:cold shock CspA family protein
MDWDSSDNESEFEGFTVEDGTEIPDAGSDISVSTPPTLDDESDFDTWSRNLHKPNVRDFNDTFGATFTLEDNQQENFFLINSFQDELIEKITRDKTLCYEMHKGEARSQMEANKCH